jgi:hypothetical protein
VSFVFHIELKSGYLLVSQSGCPSVEEVLPLQADLAQAAAQHSVKRVLFDTRELTYPGEQVRNCMIHWLDNSAVFDVQAIVMNSDLMAVRTSMDGLAKGISRRGFRTIGQAETWLTKRQAAP